MHRSRVVLAVLVVLVLGLAACSDDPSSGPSGPSGPSGSSESRGTAPASDVRVRVSLDGDHDVVVAQRTADGPWSDPERVLTLDDRECGAVEPASSGDLVAATVECDDTWYADEAPTRSVALVGGVGSEWSHHELEGESYSAPAVSPSGSFAVWPQAGSVLRWSADGGFGTVDAPSAQALSVDDEGDVRTADLVAGRHGTVLRITDGSHSQDVALPAGAGGGEEVYEGVAFRGPDRLVVRSESGTVVVVRDADRWVVQEPQE